MKIDKKAVPSFKKVPDHRAKEKLGLKLSQAQSRSIVMERSRGHCEGCGRMDSNLQWAHLAGRRNIVSEPICSLPDLTVALCFGCHADIDQNKDPEKRNRLRAEGLKRLSQRFGYANIPEEVGEDALAGMRYFERVFQAMGFEEQKVIIER